MPERGDSDATATRINPDGIFVREDAKIRDRHPNAPKHLGKQGYISTRKDSVMQSAALFEAVSGKKPASSKAASSSAKTFKSKKSSSTKTSLKKVEKVTKQRRLAVTEQ